jgi:beta-galactosidase
MALRVFVQPHNGRPMLHINGEPTTEWLAYGNANALPDFTAGGCRIVQFHASPEQSWWRGLGQYAFEPIEQQIEAFLSHRSDVLLMPRINFGYAGEAWWAELHPEELSVGRRLDGSIADYRTERVRPIDCWYSAGSHRWAHDAATALAAFVQHFEARYPDNILGYQVGAGISVEWFRWWNFVDDIYEDYSEPAQQAFRAFLSRRYEDDEALKEAWHRRDVSRETATVPEPARLHKPQRGFFRDPATERDVIDWLDCLSDCSATQLLALCYAAKEAAHRNKIVGVFYGYCWGHWNNQNPARSGHLALDKVLASPDVDYISSPYHYDNRYAHGVHHAQTVPEAIARAGKLHLDEIDTLLSPAESSTPRWAEGRVPPDGAASRRYLLRDAAAVLGTAGGGWWMDLTHSRWYDDPQIHATLRELQALARQSRDWPTDSAAEVALVIDHASYAHCDLRSLANLLFGAWQRQFPWATLGIPFDTLRLSEVSEARPYHVYVFLNPWCVTPTQRRALLRRIRKPDVTSIWFHGAGFSDGHAVNPCQCAMLTGIDIAIDDLAPASEVTIDPQGSLWAKHTADHAPEDLRYAAALSPHQQDQLITRAESWQDTPLFPRFSVTDPDAEIAGRYVDDQAPALAIKQTPRGSSVYSAIPMLPGWLLRSICLTAGVHAPAPLGFEVRQRGPLLSVYAPNGGTCDLAASPGHALQPLSYDADTNQWRPTGTPAATLALSLEQMQTRYFWRSC